MSSDFIFAINVDQLEEDVIKQVTVVGRSILLIKHKDEIFAVASRCPHMGCSLATGKLNNYILTCPCHGWSFDIRNGEYQLQKAIKLETFETKIQDGQVLVKALADFW
jgi:nitrite reductase/ring-hydroxylating ferredoxin subunit